MPIDPLVMSLRKHNELLVSKSVEIFAALADPTRFRILQALTRQELSVSELSDIAEVSHSAASHQMRILRDRDLVRSRRDGQRILYSLSDDHVTVLIEQGFAHAEHAHMGDGFHE